MNLSLIYLMPAINLPRLKIQTAYLMEKYGDPEGFVRELHNLFDSYSDRLLRNRSIASPVSILPSYRVLPAVMKQLELELGGIVQKDPEHALPLADMLWEDGFLESRMLASFLLGRVQPHGDEFLERLTLWVSETKDPTILNSLLSKSLTKMRAESQDDFLALMEKWSHQTNKKMWGNVVMALIPLLKDKEFHNLPTVFIIVQPILEMAPATMQKELSSLVNALFQASPVETTFFIRQTITLSTRTHIVQNMRRIMPTLPLPLQEALHELVRR